MSIRAKKQQSTDNQRIPNIKISAKGGSVFAFSLSRRGVTPLVNTTEKGRKHEKV